MADDLAFISDIHLRPNEPETISAFLTFLDGVAERFPRILLVGDIFDFWIGPKHLKRDDYTDVLDRLRSITDAGTQVDFIYGNRDFILGRAFERRTGVRVLGRQVDLELGGKKVRVEHGDRIYNRNWKYSVYRRLVDSFVIRSIYKGLPGRISWGLAGGLRSHSSEKGQVRPFEDPEEVRERAVPLIRDGYDVVICGHLHRVYDLDVTAGDRSGRLIVLGDWSDSNRYLEYRDGEFSLVPFRESTTA
jgi:UDP-2,3-diacylglucosamine hydrolase